MRIKVQTHQCLHLASRVFSGTSLLDEGLFCLCTLLPIWFSLIYMAEGTSERYGRCLRTRNQRNRRRTGVSVHRILDPPIRDPDPPESSLPRPARRSLHLGHLFARFDFSHCRRSIRAIGTVPCIASRHQTPSRGPTANKWTCSLQREMTRLFRQIYTG